MQRIGKQFIYGVFYLAIFGGLIYASYFFLVKPAPTCTDRKQNQEEAGLDCGGPNCAPCTAGLSPVAIRLSTVLRGAEPVALVRLANPNTTFGAERISYRIEVLDSGDAALRTLEGETFVYPGEQEKNLVFSLAGLTDARSLRVTLGEPQWKPLSDFSKPDFTFVQTRVSFKDGKAIVQGEIRSNETVLFDNVTVGAIFFSESGDLVGASQTSVQTVEAFERRAFNIEFPLGNLTINPDSTRFYYNARRP